MDHDANKKEALLLLKKFMNSKSDLTEDEEIELFLRLDELSPDPYISDYVFYPEGKEMTSEEIIEKAFNYKPICL